MPDGRSTRWPCASLDKYSASDRQQLLIRARLKFSLRLTTNQPQAFALKTHTKATAYRRSTVPKQQDVGSMPAPPANSQMAGSSVAEHADECETTLSSNAGVAFTWTLFSRATEFVSVPQIGGCSRQCCIRRWDCHPWRSPLAVIHTVSQ